VAEVVLFHHVQGLTDGVRAFAAALEKGGHTVHTPDLFNGERPATVDEGIALVQAIGDEELDKRTTAAIASLPAALVYGGFSFGGATAQALAQTTPGARGALLYESCVSLTEDWSFGLWPDGLAVQIHGMDHDPYFADEGDLEAAEELVAIVGPQLAELFIYPGDKHLFTDSSLPSYDAEATALVIRRSVEFLDKLG
jgi:dienelactone hydrolase